MTKLIYSSIGHLRLTITQVGRSCCSLFEQRQLLNLNKYDLCAFRVMVSQAYLS
jgi:hypothetical protein